MVHVVALMGTLIALVFSVGIYGDFAVSLGTIMPNGFMIWPQFAFVRYIVVVAIASHWIINGDLR